MNEEKACVPKPSLANCCYRDGNRMEISRAHFRPRRNRVDPATDRRESRSQPLGLIAETVRGLGLEAAEWRTARYGLSRSAVDAGTRRRDRTSTGTPSSAGEAGAARSGDTGGPAGGRPNKRTRPAPEPDGAKNAARSLVQVPERQEST